MRTDKLLGVLQSVSLASCEESSDGHLLRAFVLDKDESAFAALVQRHGPMVHRVCLRLLGHVPDAEDAFQATFFVLARKARSLDGTRSLGPWLHGVAIRIGKKARMLRSKKRTTPLSVDPISQSDPSNDAIREEESRMLDEAVARLPRPYRDAIIVCCMQENTLNAASHLLGAPVGTIAARISRGKTMLEKSLRRKGVACDANVVLLAASRGVSRAILTSEIPKSAVLILQGGTSIGTGISPLAYSLFVGVASNMSMQMWFVRATVFLVLTLGLGGTTWAVQSLRQDPPVAVSQNAKSRPITNPEKRLKELRKARLDAVNIEAKGRMDEFIAGRGTLAILLSAMARQLDSKLEVADSIEKRKLAYEENVANHKPIYETMQKRYELGRIMATDYKQAEYEYLNAQIKLEMLK